MHFISTIFVFLGAMFSAVWIVVANSWQQTPAGFHIVGSGMNARAEVTDFWEMVFNPSSMQRLGHVIIGAILSGTFLVLSVNAWYILKKRTLDIAKPAFKIALIVAVLFSLLQLFSGDRSAGGVAKNQPIKMAALEGHFDSSAAADFYLVGWVNQQGKKTSGIKIPGGLSFLLHNDFNAPVMGLNAVKQNEQPGQVNAVFQFYHIMIIIGFALIALCLFASYKWIRGTLFNSNWLMHVFAWSVILPQVANQCGWFAAEMGRQPWVVYGLLRTSDAFSKTVTANQVLFSLIMFFVVYSLLFVLFIYLLNKKIKAGYEHIDPAEEGLLDRGKEKA